METATALWTLDELVDEVVRQVVDTGAPPSVVVDGMMPLHLKPADQQRLLRRGLISLANDKEGMRGYRSGRARSVHTKSHSIAGEEHVIDDWALGVLRRLRFQAADETIKGVMDFTNEDARHALHLHVTRLRERADRVEPFFRALVQATEGGLTLREQRHSEVQRVAMLALECELTEGELDDD